MSEKPIQLQPLDEHNLELESNVHPADWTNPTPNADYHLVVIGRNSWPGFRCRSRWTGRKGRLDRA